MSFKLVIIFQLELLLHFLYLFSSYSFILVAVESAGTHGQDATEFLHELGRHIAVATGDLHLSEFLPCDAMRCTLSVIVILSVCLSVRLFCLSVCHTRGLCPHGSTYDHDFFTIW